MYSPYKTVQFNKYNLRFITSPTSIPTPVTTMSTKYNHSIDATAQLSTEATEKLTDSAMQLLFLNSKADELKRQLEPFKKQEKEVAAQSINLKDELKNTLAMKKMLLESCKEIMQRNSINTVNVPDPNSPGSNLGTLQLSNRGKPKNPTFNVQQLYAMIEKFQVHTGNRLLEQDVNDLMNYISDVCLEISNEAPTCLTIKKGTSAH